MSNKTVYLVADEVGLVKWDEFKKPPYLPQDYLDAYNNGIRLAQSINDAYTNGASKVVLERGKYPTCYANDNRYVANMNPTNLIKNTNNLEVDGNSSCLFVIFDSVNRSPYHTGLGALHLPAYALSGGVLFLEGNTNLNLHGFEFRGDQYNRSWVYGEKDTEQTYAIKLGKDNYFTKIDVVAHGFRGDAISNYNSNISLKNITGTEEAPWWFSGGIDETGVEVEAVGTYRTPKIDISNSTIYRNTVSLDSKGYLQTIHNRDDAFKMFFYDSLGTYISNERAYQAEPVVLPPGTSSIAIVAYGDERRTPTVTYGTYVHLTSGASNYCEIKGEYYANHRGAVSNLCSNTTVDAYIHDIGTTKYGFPIYYSTTRYGVNFEDVYAGTLTVKGRIENTGSAIITNCRRLVVEDCVLKKCLFSGVAGFETKEVIIKNTTMDYVGNPFEVNVESLFKIKRNISITNCSIKNTTVRGDYSKADDLVMKINGNQFDKCSLDLKGNDNNLFFNDNIITYPYAARLYSLCAISNTAQSNNNSIFIKDLPEGNREGLALFFNGRIAKNNLIVNDTSVGFSNYIAKSGSTLEFNNLKVEQPFSKFDIRLLDSSLAINGEVSIAQISDCSFNGTITLGDKTGKKVANSVTTFNNSNFTNITKGFEVSFNKTDVDSKHLIVFNGCYFDLSNSDSQLIDLRFINNGKIDFEFNNCIFYSSSEKLNGRYLFGLSPLIDGVSAIAKDSKFFINGRDIK